MLSDGLVRDKAFHQKSRLPIFAKVGFREHYSSRNLIQCRETVGWAIP